jgi:hypothetical protein
MRKRVSAESPLTIAQLDAMAQVYHDFLNNFRYVPYSDVAPPLVMQGSLFGNDEGASRGIVQAMSPEEQTRQEQARRKTQELNDRLAFQRRSPEWKARNKQWEKLHGAVQQAHLR